MTQGIRTFDWVTVVRTVDGDTVDVRVDLGFYAQLTERFRLARINTPEKGEPGYVEAAEFVRTWTTNRDIRLRVSKQDKWHRYLAEIEDKATGENLNDLLLSLGHREALRMSTYRRFLLSSLYVCAVLVAIAIGMAAYNLAFAGSVQPPDRLTAQFCASRVSIDGQVIASLRWEKGMEKAEVLAIPYADEAPDWYRVLIDGWIEDAYAWAGSPGQWLGKIMNQCNSMTDS